MKNIQFNPVRYLFINPCSQLQTSGTSIFNNSLNLSSPVEPKYCKDCTHVYEDTDILNQEYNPLMSENSESGDVAQNYNESSNVSNYGKAS